MTIKRIREEEAETIETANFLMLLSRVGDSTDQATTPTSGGRFFECKTCNKKFHSFQALGGHRASHKKLKLMAELLTQPSNSQRKRKKHECPMCGLEFALGQALGGHMRRHRGTISEGRHEIDSNSEARRVVPLLKRSNSKRVSGLDLNLTPYENDLQQTMKPPPALLLDCAI